MGGVNIVVVTLPARNIVTWKMASIELITSGRL